MSNNPYLHEKRFEEHLQDLRRERRQARFLASLSRPQRSMTKHLVSRLGTHLVTLGSWLERAEARGNQIVSSVAHE